MDTIGEMLVPRINEKKVRRMGSTLVEQTMASSLSAKLSGILALGNQVTTNSSACNTGTEAIHDAYWRIRNGQAERMLAGGAESSSKYVWGGFDAMKVLNADSNHEPEQASRPLSASAGGFIPGSGSGVLFLESLENPNILSQLIIFKYILSWFALLDIVVNKILFFILSYETLIIKVARPAHKTTVDTEI